MAAWKQIVFTLVILVAAAAAWARFFPGRAGSAGTLGHRLGLCSAPATTGAVDTAKQASGRNAAGRPANVVALPAGTATINDRLQAIGTGRANASVTVNPYSSGRLVEFLVQSGTRVDKGQIIAVLDSETEMISQDRAKLALQDAQAKLERVKSLRASNAATPVAVADAEVVLAGAKLALQDAELALQRRSIVAPIAGTVGILPISAGNYVTSQSAIATLDDRSSHPGRVPGAGALRRRRSRSARNCRRRRSPIRATPIPARFRPSTTTSTKRAAPCWSRRRSPIRRIRCAPACPSGITMQLPRRHLSGRQPAGDPVGLGRRLCLADRGRQGQARCRAHHPAQHRDRADRRRRSKMATWW